MRKFRKSHESSNEFWDGQHKREHWYVDNAVYFLTARCVDRYPAFELEEAKRIFWDRFDHWSKHHGFVPVVRSLLDNHYHVLGYRKVGADLGEMMRKIHGSIAKLVDDILPARRVPFWRAASTDISLHSAASGQAWGCQRLALLPAYASRCGDGSRSEASTGIESVHGERALQAVRALETQSTASVN